MRAALSIVLAVALLSAAWGVFAEDGVENHAKKQSYYEAVEQYQSGVSLSAEQIALIKQFGYSGSTHPIIDNFGGPDLLGYAWLDSEEPNGPAYEWIDITATGTEVTDQMNDDNYIGPFDIGFNFPFYDTSYSQFWLHSNGVISFTDQYVSLSNYQMPYGQYGPMVAWFWDDLDPDTPDWNLDDGGFTYYETLVIDNQNAIVFEYFEYERFPQGPEVPQMTAELILFEDGTIKIQYQSFDVGFVVNNCSIGIQNETGDVGLSALYNGSIADYPYDELAIEFSRLDPNATVSGTVSDSHTGIPIVGAEVAIGSGTDITGPGGTYSIEGAYAGTLSVTVTATGYFRYYSSVTLAEGENTFDFELDALPPPQTSDYFTDFEDDQGFLFTDGTATNTWTYGEPTFEPNNAYSGTFAWTLGLNTDYDNSIDEWLETATSWQITSPESYIAYWHWFSLESCCDGYNLQVSVDGGETWMLIYPDQGYTDDDGVFTNDYQSCFNNTGEREETWEYVSYSLANYVGQNVWFGWRATSDSSVRYPGVSIDDLEIYVGQEPGPDAVLDLVPVTTTVPPGGGEVVYDASFISEFAITIPNVDFWTWAETPSGDLVGPLTRLSFTHTPFMNTYVTGMTLDVPAFAEGGEYIFNGAVGTFPSNPQRQDNFTFVKIGAATASAPQNPYDPIYWDHSTGQWIAADGSEEEVIQLPAEYALGTAYPNPFNPSTSFTVALPESAELTVNVFNVQGRQVSSLYSGAVSAGELNLTFDGQGFASGIYFIQAQIPGRLNAMQKVTLMK
jgi:Carboxypeptidase regulatory-like domain/Immune inhibitor A-like, MAM domain/Secretion system C-terminal sorting domain